jgi:perosamine synthetase
MKIYLLGKVYCVMKKIIKALSYILESPKFTFLASHRNVDKNELSAMRALVGTSDSKVVIRFEDAYASLIGAGSCVAFASARMGFYSTMKVLDISSDDEVILLGATCSVMVNAVLKVGAKPVFADIDPDTFGSSLRSIKQCVSIKTKLIVAQHSFGIPCDIEPIMRFARQKNIFVVEDCALTLGSKINGKIVGNFGDVAIFSTDHSKPLSSLTGGVVYSNSEKIIGKIRKIQNESPELNVDRQKALWRRLLVKRRLASWPSGFGRLIDYLDLICEKFVDIPPPFLSSDYSSIPGHKNYPYPAKMPTFLAQLGSFEIEKWPQIKVQRIKSQELILSLLGETDVKRFLPASYHNINLDIVPLRVCWSMPDGVTVRRKLSKLIDTQNTWFMRPIIAGEANLEGYGYHWSTCPNSEALGPNMINLPCDLDEQSIRKVIKLLT